jgi:hypothetical protein
LELPTTKRNDVGIEKEASNKLKYTSDIYDLNILVQQRELPGIYLFKCKFLLCVKERQG